MCALMCMTMTLICYDMKRSTQNDHTFSLKNDRL